MKAVLMLMISIFLVQGVVNAGGFLGQRYIGAYYGSMTPGDNELKEIDDAIISYGVEGRFPLTEHLDITMTVGFEKMEGPVTIIFYDGGSYYYLPVTLEADAVIFGSDIIFHFLPGEIIDPFISAGFSYYDMDISMTDSSGYSISEDETDSGFGAGAGVEFSLNEYAAIVPQLSFASFDGESDVSFTIQGVFWLQDVIGFMLGVGYAFDEGDTVIQGGVGVKF